MDILKQLREVTLSVLPIGLFTIILSLLLGVMDSAQLGRFLLSCLLVIGGLTLFLSGVDVGLIPIGTKIGATLTRSRNLPLMLAASVALGMIITIPEPDVQVLATQVHAVRPGVSVGSLVVAIAIGVGIFFSISIARTILKLPMKIIFLLSYISIFSIAAFSDDFFVSIAFDSGGATTGPLSVPFIMALGMGVAALRKHDDEAEFGYVALSSIGPVIAVLVLGLSSAGGTEIEAAAEAEAVIPLSELFSSKFVEVGISLLPLVAVCLLLQLLFMKMPRIEATRAFVGIAYAYIGIVLFFTGVEYSFSEVARELGDALILISPALLYAVGFVFGLCVVLAEPAVMVLTEQVEDVSEGRIPRRIMLVALALGVGLAVVMALVRTVHSLSIWTFLLPGYILIMLFMIRTPGLFSAIGFDSGGVATGPMSSTFLLPFAMGAASGSSEATLASSFGIIAMIAMMPILVIELLGIIYQTRVRKAEKEAAG